MRENELLSVKQRFGIIGNSPLLNLAIKKAILVAKTDVSVLITGESGTGKESFSKIIHALGKRKHGVFISLNCGALPAGTIDSELFGHEKGAFTGASDARKGYFETVNGGTIFLDEIGEMPMQTQSKLLRVLEYGEYIRVGSSKVQKTDVRVVAATNKDLMQATQKGEFREDLYYRLNTVPIEIPPLRKRGEDIHLIFRKFVNDFVESNRGIVVRLNEEAKKVLLSYNFSGNIRELKNITHQLCIFEHEPIIDALTLKKYLPNNTTSLPSIYKGGNKDENLTDRDILYKILFDLKKEVGNLKKLINYIIQNDGGKDSTPLNQKHSKLLESTLGEAYAPTQEEHATEIEPQDYEASQTEERASETRVDNRVDNRVDTRVDTRVDNKRAEQKSMIFINHEGDKKRNFISYDESKIEDVDATAQDSHSLSLEMNEKQLIMRALKRNFNKRKYAAHDLGISERTLYRKIKQYDLEK